MAGAKDFSIDRGATFQATVTYMSYRRAVSDASMAAASTTLTSASADFSAADVGRVVSVKAAGASRADLVTTISSVQTSSSVTLGAQSTFAVSDAELVVYVPIDLTGATASMVVRDRRGDSVLALTDSSGLTLGGALGTVAVQITSAQTLSLVETLYAYDLDVTIGSVVTRLLRGQLTVLS